MYNKLKYNVDTLLFSTTIIQHTQSFW